jgi:hypothetical protein
LRIIPVFDVGRLGLTTTKVSNFEQTIAVRVCCSDRNRGIALSGQKTTPPGIIGLGGVARFTRTVVSLGVTYRRPAAAS